MFSERRICVLSQPGEAGNIPVYLADLDIICIIRRLLLSDAPCIHTYALCCVQACLCRAVQHRRPAHNCIHFPTATLFINPLEYYIEGHVALDRNPGPGYNTLLSRLLPGDFYSAYPHRHFHTLPGLHCQIHTLTRACQAGMQFVPFYMMEIGMNRPGREPMIYRMRGGHANHF